MARALYIHWPFCARKCPYCDFNSHVRSEVDVDAWQAALIADLRHEIAVAGAEPLTSIFFGGGTPSLMSPALVGQLLEEAEELCGFDSDIEITLEANPSSVEAVNFAALANAGINRASLGVQALDDDVLKFLGRLHSVNEGLHALGTAQSIFSRVSFDLIYARPDQTLDQWKQELETALDFGTEHLSLYQLTIEPGTRFSTEVRRGVFNPLDDDRAAELFELTREMTATAGLPAYEISNHARPGAESRHNLTYWRYEDYLGIGPGAHGRREGMATQRHRKPENFLKAVTERGHGTCECRSLDTSEQAAEALLMGLRLNEGLDLGQLAQRFDKSVDEVIDQKVLSRLDDLGLMAAEGSRIRVTNGGFPVLDAILGELVASDLVAA